MRRTWLAILCAVLVVAGCGGGDDEGAPGGGADSQATPVAENCEEGDALRAGDMIGSPQGFEVVRGDQEAIDAYAGQYRKFLGDRWRGHDARVVVRRGANNGVAVIVMNATEDVGSADEILEGAREGESDTGRDAGVEPIVVAGESGAVLEAPDGAFVALARAGPCAIVVLTADSDRLLREVASLLQPA